MSRSPTNDGQSTRVQHKADNAQRTWTMGEGIGSDFTHTMIGPSLGTFSSPITRTSVKNELAAVPAMNRIILWSSMRSEDDDILAAEVVVEVRVAAAPVASRNELAWGRQRCQVPNGVLWTGVGRTLHVMGGAM